MSDTSNLTPSDIVSWFRSQAKVFNSMADTIESTFSRKNPVSNLSLNGHSPMLSATQGISPEKVRDLVGNKKMRASTLAKQFAVEEWEVERIVKNPNNGLEFGERGWIRLKGQRV